MCHPDKGLVSLKNPRPYGAVMYWRGFARKACAFKKFAVRSKNWA